MEMSLSILFVLGGAAIFAEGKDVYWGYCDKWDRDRNGCAITSGEKCSDHLSPGPANATLRLVIGNLPPSTPERPVHVHFFAAREAPGFNPVDGPHLYTIYEKARRAYPNYTDPDFNGGNVRVNESGHAVLMLMAPSTYVVCGNRIRWPHLKLRLCTGEDFLTYRAESLDFTQDGIHVRACSVKDETKLYKVVSFTRTDVPIPPANNNSIALTTAQRITTTAEATTTTKFLTSTPVAPAAVVDDSFDWDALEYSPVYQCLTDDLVYNHFTSKCAEKCPPDTDLKHGQCVRQDTKEEDVRFNMSWDLKVHCDEECWENKKSRSLHMLRLAVGDHLDIPFQEVLKVVLRPSVQTDRRLSNHLTDASLFVSVTSGRIAADQGESLLRTFLPDKTSASQLLGLEVHNLEVVDKKVIELDKLDAAEESDEFAQFYTENEPADEPVYSSIPGSPSDVIPAGAVVGMAIGIIVLGMLTAVALWYKRRLNQRNAQAHDTVKGQKVGAPEEAKLPQENNKIPA